MEVLYGILIHMGNDRERRLRPVPAKPERRGRPVTNPKSITEGMGEVVISVLTLSLAAALATAGAGPARAETPQSPVTAARSEMQYTPPMPTLVFRR